MRLCSACLLGVKCRWDGDSRPNKKVINLLKKEILIPVCPEQLGGLTTPREPAEQLKNKVFTKSGKDVTKNFKNGAKKVFEIVKLFKIKNAILKQKSPSCGYGLIYNGTFSEKLIKGNGVTTTFLKKRDIKVITEENLE